MPLWNYILENEVLEFLRDRGRRVFIHSLVTGGQALSDTLNGFERVAETTRDRNIVVWLNEYFGEIETAGRPFETFRAAEQHAEKLLGTVVIRERNPQTYGDDVREMLSRRWTFDEALASAEFSLIAKQRLTIFRRDILEQLEKLPLA